MVGSHVMGRRTLFVWGLLLSVAAALVGCHRPSMTAAQWDACVIKASTPVLVEFWRPGCPGCDVLRPQLAVLASSYGDRVALYDVNTDTTWDLTEANHVSRLPAVLLFVNGDMVQRWEGELDITPYAAALAVLVPDAPRRETHDILRIDQAGLPAQACPPGDPSCTTTPQAAPDCP